MGKIVYFEESSDKGNLCWFVKSVSRPCFLSRMRLEYTLDILEAKEFAENDKDSVIKKMTDAIRRDYPDAVVHFGRMGQFMEDNESNTFFVIVHEKNGICFFSGYDLGGNANYVEDVHDASIVLSKDMASQTATSLRGDGRCMVYVLTVYLNVENKFVTPSYMLICTSRNDGKHRYLSRIDGERMRFVMMSDNAMRMTFDEAAFLRRRLIKKSKGFWFILVPAFEDNVHSSMAEGYMKQHNLPMKIIKCEMRLGEIQWKLIHKKL